MTTYFEQISIGAKVDTKGFKKADTALGQLNKSVKGLAKSFGVAYGTAQVLSYAKASVKAFAEDDKAAKLLTRSLDNLGLAFADPAVKKFISDLETQYHVLDDRLRPAYQKLVTTTGDWKKSQDLLKTALDLSAMSGNDVESVVSDLSKAYAGNTKGLQKYGLGLTKTELAAMSFEQILNKITQISKGQATEAANSYAGALDALNVSASNAQETIGKGLVQAFTEAAGANGIGAMQNGIADLASGISDAIIGTERLVKLFLLTADFDFKGAIAFYKETKKADMLARQQYGGAAANKYLAEAQAAADKLARKRALELLAIKNKQLAAEKAALAAKKLSAAIDKANLALGKADDVFNMDKIQIAAALANEAEQLANATNGAQLLQIANDTARLNVKRDILALEDAIASKDTASINAATAKLNEDLKILGALTGQSAKLADIKSILDSLKPKELIDQANLDEALRKIQLMLDSLKKINYIPPTPPVPYGADNKSNVANNQYSNQVGNGLYGMQIPLSIDATNLNTALLGGVVTQIMPNLQEYTPSGMSSGIGSNLKEYNYNVSVYANTVATPDELTGLIQDTIIRLNKQGDYLTTAGSL